MAVANSNPMGIPIVRIFLRNVLEILKLKMTVNGAKTCIIRIVGGLTQKP